MAFYLIANGVYEPRDEEDAKVPHGKISIGIRRHVEDAHENEWDYVFDVVQMIAAKAFDVIVRADNRRCVSCQLEIFWISESLDETRLTGLSISLENLTSFEDRFIIVSAPMLISLTIDAAE